MYRITIQNVLIKPTYRNKRVPALEIHPQHWVFYNELKKNTTWNFSDRWFFQGPTARMHHADGAAHRAMKPRWLWLGYEWFSWVNWILLIQWLIVGKLGLSRKYGRSGRQSVNDFFGRMNKCTKIHWTERKIQSRCKSKYTAKMAITSMSTT